MKPPRLDRDTVGHRPTRKAGKPHASQIDALFTNQSQRPEAIGPVDPDLLGPVARVALTLDGTLTTLLAVLAEEPIRSEPDSEAPEDFTALAAMVDAAGEATENRAVLLCGADSERSFVATRSVLVPGRFPPGFTEVLARPGAGIGQALVESQAETRRELLWWGEEDGALVRAYRIIHQGKPMVVIEERFLADFEVLAA